MKLLVIGRHGQLARALGELAKETSSIALQFIGRPELDLEVTGAARRALSEITADLIINAAAFTAVDLAESQPELAWRINAEAAGEIAAAAADGGVPIIHISTDYVFDGRAGPYGEDAQANPINVYGRTKLAGEQAVRAATSEHLILRTSWVYSPFGSNFVRTMVAEGHIRRVLRVVDDQRGNPTSALDLAEALLRIATSYGRGNLRPAAGTYHLAGSGMASWFELAEAVKQRCAALGRDHARLEAIATADWTTPAARPSNSALDCSKFRGEFGFCLPDWRSSLPLIVERLVGVTG